MEITIDIPSQPEGYSIPVRKAVYLPFGDMKILIGDAWFLASDQLELGGGSYIHCRKCKPSTKGEAT